MIDSDRTMEYLSDDDLNMLISNTENEPQVNAPSYIERNVLSIIETGERRY